MTLTLVAVPILVSIVLALAVPRVARLLPPPTSVRLVTVASLVTALSTGFVLSVTAFTALARLPLVAATGHWSVRVLGRGDEVPVPAGLLAAALVAALLAFGLRYAATAAADLVSADATCRRLGSDTDGLVVVDDARPEAYALPGLHGRVVVSTAMLRALPGDERRALLAHENAHLRHRHHLYIQLTELGARADPLLRPLVPVVRDGVERWADEEAATATGDRRLTARAVARAALAHADGRGPARVHRIALGIAGSATVRRTQALLADPPRPRTALAFALVALMTVGPGAALTSALLTEHWFELAQAAVARR